MLIERDRDDAARVVLATVAPALFATTLVPPQLAELGVPRWGVAAGVGALLLFAAWSLPWWTGLARWSAAVGLAIGAGLWALAHPDRAGTGLVLVLAAGSLVAGLWPAYTGGSWLRDRGPVAAAATVVLLVALLAWSVGTGGPGGTLGLAGAAAVPAAVAHRSAKSRGARQVAAVALLIPVVFTVLGLAELRPVRATVLLAVGPVLLLMRSVPSASVVRSTGTLLLDFVLASPARQLVVSFASLCTVGTLVLQLPVADTAGLGHDLVDAAFTAVSAGCVTGLAVLDTPNDFTLFGQVAILALIQLGGLGIMTFAAGAVLWAGSRLRVRHERVAAELLGGGAQLDLWKALRRVLAVTAVTELTGAVLLFPAYLLHGDTVLMALWRSVFTSVSAFCNAGFALSSNNMIAYQRDPWVLFVVGSIITLGSLGPVVVTALPDVVARRRISLFVRMSVSGTVVLLAGGVVAILLLETHHTFAQLGWIDRMANAWFHAVVPRTAGFNSVDLAQAHPATITLTMLLMFVGGCSGSTAGGIKITTAMVLLLATVAAARTRTTAEFWNRSIRHRTVYDAGAIATVYAGIGLAGLLMFQVTQRQPFDMALFEVLSALGTVGLSIGGTMQADSVGKIVLIALMFAGRVGPLTVFFFLSEGERVDGAARVPERGGRRRMSSEYTAVEQVLVVGLGNFGMGFARALVAQGAEVVAVDRRQDRVHRAAAFVTEAVRGDAIEQDQLARLGPARRDLCVVAIGDESLEASILCTTLLRQMGAKRVIARATNDLHERILHLVGAHEVVNPERSFGERLAARLTHRGIVGELALGPDLVITELETPPAFGGRTLGELGALPERFGVTVVAVRHGQTGQVVLPAPTERMQVDDVLVVVSDPRAAQEMLRRV